MSIPSKSNKPVADVEADADAYTAEEWKPSKNELLIMISLSFISLIVAIDSTVLVTALPVSRFHAYHQFSLLTFCLRKLHIS